MCTHLRSTPRIAVLYEHPTWFQATFDELARRGVEVLHWFAPDHVFDPSAPYPDVDLVLNRMSPSAFTRGNGHTIPYTTELLDYLSRHGVPVLHGADVYGLEFSKARQIALLARLGIAHPRSRVIHHPRHAPTAAAGFTFPVLIKPNVGGSGAGIRSFDTPDDLADATASGDIDLGFDGIALVQERLSPCGGSVVRVEVLGGRFLYAIELQLAAPDSFNLCPADACRVPGEVADANDTRASVRAFEPPDDVVRTVERLTAAAGIEVGGVEYLIDDRDGRPVYYDVNALSNFVADAPNVIGFDPVPRFVDHVLGRAAGARNLAA